MRRSYNRLIARLTCIVMLFALCSTAVAEEYTGAAMGRNGDVNVSVVHEDGRIVSVTVGENQETLGVGDNAFNRQYPGIGIGISWAANSGAYAAGNIASGLE